MYIKKVSIKNIKSLSELEISFPSPYYGWHVLLGDNGSGKSSLLKSISLCLLEEKQGYALKENFKNWITKGKTSASCQLNIVYDEIEEKGLGKHKKENSVTMEITEDGNIEQHIFPKPIAFFKRPQWQYNAAFGPYRRLGEKDTKSIEKFSSGNLENHITLFDNSYNLTSAVQWLMDLKFMQLSTQTKNIFDDVIHFINDSDLLPNKVRIEEVNHEGVFFVDGDNKDIEINELSDGYQSIFSLTLEILRQISKIYDIKEVIKDWEGDLVVTVSGVILIDEIDIHLHPQWQAKVGEWFKKFFPKIQFIVTTHSPIVCQSAEGATIWKIEHSKSGELSHQITGQQYKRMVYGSIIDAISTDNFGEENIERSDKSNEMLNRLAELNMKSIRGKITKSEKEELKDLKSILPSEN